MIGLKKGKVLCFGELLLRVSPSGGNDNAEKHPVLVYVGGAEANVATALAGWDVPVKYCTALPNTFMSKHMQQYLEYRGIFASSIVFSDNGRIGLYYLDRGADLKSSVVYDRDGSSFSLLKPGMIDWDKVLQDVAWLNFSAISPALNENIALVCKEALEAAVRKNIVISVDLNYRARLWKYGKKPVEVMPVLVEHCDVVMGNIWAANTLLGIPIDENIHDNTTGREAYLHHAMETSKAIIEKFPKCKVVANTFRFDSEANNVKYYTSLYTENKQFNSQEFSCEGVVDRSGSGDCYMAGLIYGLYNKLDYQDVVNYASAAAFGKLQESGDITEQDSLSIFKEVKR